MDALSSLVHDFSHTSSPADAITIVLLISVLHVLIRDRRQLKKNTGVINQILSDFDKRRKEFTRYERSMLAKIKRLEKGINSKGGKLSAIQAVINENKLRFDEIDRKFFGYLELLDADRNKKARMVSELKQELSEEEKKIAKELKVKH